MAPYVSLSEGRAHRGRRRSKDLGAWPRRYRRHRHLQADNFTRWIQTSVQGPRVGIHRWMTASALWEYFSRRLMSVLSVWLWQRPPCCGGHQKPRSGRPQARSAGKGSTGCQTSKIDTSLYPIAPKSPQSVRQQHHRLHHCLEAAAWQAGEIDGAFQHDAT